MHSKIAAIAGATGQDGAHLAGLLLAKAMSSMVSKRRSSSVPIPPASVTYSTTYSMMFETGMPFHLHYGDLTDGSNLIRRAQDPADQDPGLHLGPLIGHFLATT